MPIVRIEMWPMKTEKKQVMIKGISEVFEGMGILDEAVNVVIHETDQDNWGSAGEQHSVKFRDIIENMKK